jgi:hypothetical protein
MDTNKYTTTRKTTTGQTVEVTIERGTWTENVTADGMDIGLIKTHVVNTTTITLRDAAGKTLASASEIAPLSRAYSQYAEAVKAGCVGMIGRAYIKQATYDLIVDAIAEASANAPKTAKQTEIETAEANRKAAREAWLASAEGKADSAERERHDRLMRQMDRADSDL